MTALINLGVLTMSGWIAAAPTGHDEAFLLLTTPDDRAQYTMAEVTTAFGIPLRGGPVPVHGVHVQLCGLEGLELVCGQHRFERPASVEWAAVARERRQVFMVIGMRQHPHGMDVDEYTELYKAGCSIGCVPVRP